MTVKTVISMLLTITIVALTSFAETSMEARMTYEQFTLSEASIPDTPRSPFLDGSDLADDEALANYNAWWSAKFDRQMSELPNLDRVRDFARISARIMLDGDGATNTLCSPANLWIYFNLLSNLTAGDSRAQILRAMGSDAGTDAVYNALYWDDGQSVCRPAASLWLDRRTTLSDALADRFAAQLHTSVFQGPMGETAYDEAFRAWLNEQTNGLLSTYVEGLSLNPATGLALCATVYLRCAWSQPFDPADTSPEVFHSPNGDCTVDFMHKTQTGGAVCLGEGFSAALLDLQDGGYVTLVLPDPDRSVGDILLSDELFDCVFAGREWDDVQRGRVKLSMPRIDVMAVTPLTQTMAQMGVTDVFDPDLAVFSEEIRSEGRLALSAVDQYARLIMNEDGVEAASMIVSDGALLPGDAQEIEFTLDRPFLFMVFSDTNVPVFMGIFKTP